MTTNIDNINSVLKHLYDSVNGLKECAQQVKSENFKQKLISIAQERDTFAHELQGLLTAAGANYDKYGSVAGPLHRLYIDLKGLFTNGDIEAINKEIKRGDAALIASYESAIGSVADVAYQTLLTKQLAIIVKNQFEVDASALQATA